MKKTTNQPQAPLPPPRANRGDARADGLIYWARQASGTEIWLAPAEFERRRLRLAAYVPPRKYARSGITMPVVWSPELLQRVDEIAKKLGKSRSKLVQEAVIAGLEKFPVD